MAKKKGVNFRYMVGDMSEAAFSDISSDLLIAISQKYLTDRDTDFLYLVLKGRRTKEIAMLLCMEPCEVVRRRKVLARKIRVIYLYHYKYDYMPFIKFSASVLTPERFQCLVLHYVQLMSLQKIADHMGTQASNVKRWLMGIKTVLEKAMESRPEYRVFLDSFEDLTYLNIQEIRRVGSDLRKFETAQIGHRTLKQWSTVKISKETGNGTRRN